MGCTSSKLFRKGKLPKETPFSAFMSRWNDEPFTDDFAQKVSASAPQDARFQELYLEKLVVAWYTSYETYRLLDYLNKAVNVWEWMRVTKLSTGPEVKYLERLQLLFIMRHKISNNSTDLDKALSCAEKIIDLSESGPTKIAAIRRLFLILITKATAHQDVDCLDAAVKRWRHRSSDIPREDPCRNEILARLQEAVTTMFDENHNPEKLRTYFYILYPEISSSVAADHLGLVERLKEHSDLLAQEASTLHNMYEETNNISHLDEVIRIGLDQLDLVERVLPDTAKKSLIYSGLCRRLWLKFERTESSEDLEKAISYGELALKDALPDGSNRSGWLIDLSFLKAYKYQRTRDIDDLDGVIDTLRMAGEATIVEQPNHRAYLVSYGKWLETRYKVSGASTDLAEAIHIARQVQVMDSKAKVDVQAVRLHGVSDMLGLKHDELYWDYGSLLTDNAADEKAVISPSSSDSSSSCSLRIIDEKDISVVVECCG